MQYCSKKKGEAIIEERPFTGWIDLVNQLNIGNFTKKSNLWHFQVTKLQTNKNLSTDLLNSAQQVLITRNNIRSLMKRCTNLAQQMERAVAAGAGVKEQPANLSSS